MKRKVLIIGAAGDICLETVKILSAKYNVDIRVGAREPERAKSMNLPDVEIMHFDYTNPETYDEVFYNIDNWMLVSPPAHLQIQAHVNNVINHAKMAGVKHIVNISSFGIHDDKHPMRIIESHLEDSGMDYTFLRPNCYMQYFTSYFRQMIAEDDTIRLPAKESKTSFVDMRDVADSAARLLTMDHQENKTFQLTGRRALNMYEISQIFTEILQRKIYYTQISEEEYESILLLDGWTERSINASLKYCRLVKQGWNAVITNGVFDILGRDPRTFEEFVKDHKEYWKARVHQS